MSNPQIHVQILHHRHLYLGSMSFFQILKSASNSQMYVLFQVLNSASNSQIYGRFSLSQINVQ